MSERSKRVSARWVKACGALTVWQQGAFEENWRSRQEIEQYLSAWSECTWGDQIRIAAEASMIKVSAAAKARENLIRSCELL